MSYLFAEAAVFHNLTDPPFVKDNFTVAEFEVNLFNQHPFFPPLNESQFPMKLTNNGTLLVNTTGIQTTLNCVLPDPNSITTTPLNNANGYFLAVQAKWFGCTVSTNVSVSGILSTINRYRVTSVSPCAPSNSSYVPTSQSGGPSFQPIMFWFWNPSESRGGSNKTKIVLCAPTITVYIVQASLNLTTNALDRVTIVSTITGNNNVMGSGVRHNTGINGG